MAESEKVKNKVGKPRALIVVGVVALIAVIAASAYWIISQDDERTSTELTEQEQTVALFDEELSGDLENNVEEAVLLIGLARAEFENGQYQNALEILDESLALGIDDPSVYQSAVLLQAKVLAADGQFEQAIEVLQNFKASGAVFDTPDEFVMTLIDESIAAYEQGQLYDEPEVPINDCDPETEEC